MGYCGSSLHSREEKFGCFHGSKACLGDFKLTFIIAFYLNIRIGLAYRIYPEKQLKIYKRLDEFRKICVIKI